MKFDVGDNIWATPDFSTILLIMEATKVNKAQEEQSKKLDQLGGENGAEQEVNTKNADKQFSDMVKNKKE